MGRRSQAWQLWTQDLMEKGHSTLLNAIDALTHRGRESTKTNHLHRVGVVVRPELELRRRGGVRSARTCE